MMEGDEDGEVDFGDSVMKALQSLRTQSAGESQSKDVCKYGFMIDLLLETSMKLQQKNKNLLARNTDLQTSNSELQAENHSLRQSLEQLRITRGSPKENEEKEVSEAGGSRRTESAVKDHESEMCLAETGATSVAAHLQEAVPECPEDVVSSQSVKDQDGGEVQKGPARDSSHENLDRQSDTQDHATRCSSVLDSVVRGETDSTAFEVAEDIVDCVLDRATKNNKESAVRPVERKADGHNEDVAAIAVNSKPVGASVQPGCSSWSNPPPQASKVHSDDVQQATSQEMYADNMGALLVRRSNSQGNPTCTIDSSTEHFREHGGTERRSAFQAMYDMLRAQAASAALQGVNKDKRPPVDTDDGTRTAAKPLEEHITSNNMTEDTSAMQGSCSDSISGEVENITVTLSKTQSRSRSRIQKAGSKGRQRKGKSISPRPTPFRKTNDVTSQEMMRFPQAPSKPSGQDISHEDPVSAVEQQKRDVPSIPDPDMIDLTAEDDEAIGQDIANSAVIDDGPSVCAPPLSQEVSDASRHVATLQDITSAPEKLPDANAEVMDSAIGELLSSSNQTSTISPQDNLNVQVVESQHVSCSVEDCAVSEEQTVILPSESTAVTEQQPTSACDETVPSVQKETESVDQPQDGCHSTLESPGGIASCSAKGPDQTSELMEGTPNHVSEVKKRRKRGRGRPRGRKSVAKEVNPTQNFGMTRTWTTEEVIHHIQTHHHQKEACFVQEDCRTDCSGESLREEGSLEKEPLEKKSCDIDPQNALRALIVTPSSLQFTEGTTDSKYDNTEIDGKDSVEEVVNMVATTSPVPGPPLFTEGTTDSKDENTENNGKDSVEEVLNMVSTTPPEPCLPARASRKRTPKDRKCQKEDSEACIYRRTRSRSSEKPQVNRTESLRGEKDKCEPARNTSSALVDDSLNWTSQMSQEVSVVSSSAVSVQDASDSVHPGPAETADVCQSRDAVQEMTVGEVSEGTVQSVDRRTDSSEKIDQIQQNINDKEAHQEDNCSTKLASNVEVQEMTIGEVSDGKVQALDKRTEASEKIDQIQPNMNDKEALQEENCSTKLASDMEVAAETAPALHVSSRLSRKTTPKCKNPPAKSSMCRRLRSRSKEKEQSNEPDLLGHDVGGQEALQNTGTIEAALTCESSPQNFVPLSEEMPVVSAKMAVTPDRQKDQTNGDQALPKGTENLSAIGDKESSGSDMEFLKQFPAVLQKSPVVRLRRLEINSKVQSEPDCSEDNCNKVQGVLDVEAEISSSVTQEAAQSTVPSSSVPERTEEVESVVDNNLPQQVKARSGGRQNSRKKKIGLAVNAVESQGMLRAWTKEEVLKQVRERNLREAASLAQLSRKFLNDTVNQETECHIDVESALKAVKVLPNPLLSSEGSAATKGLRKHSMSCTSKTNQRRTSKRGPRSKAPHQEDQPAPCPAGKDNVRMRPSGDRAESRETVVENPVEKVVRNPDNDVRMTTEMGKTPHVQKETADLVTTKRHTAETTKSRKDPKRSRESCLQKVPLTRGKAAGKSRTTDKGDEHTGQCKHVTGPASERRKASMLSKSNRPGIRTEKEASSTATMAKRQPCQASPKRKAHTVKEARATQLKGGRYSNRNAHLETKVGKSVSKTKGTEVPKSDGNRKKLEVHTGGSLQTTKNKKTPARRSVSSTTQKQESHTLSSGLQFPAAVQKRKQDFGSALTLADNAVEVVTQGGKKAATQKSVQARKKRLVEEKKTTSGKVVKKSGQTVGAGQFLKDTKSGDSQQQATNPGNPGQDHSAEGEVVSLTGTSSKCGSSSDDQWFTASSGCCNASGSSEEQWCSAMSGFSQQRSSPEVADEVFWNPGAANPSIPTESIDTLTYVQVGAEVEIPFSPVKVQQDRNVSTTQTTQGRQPNSATGNQTEGRKKNGQESLGSCKEARNTKKKPNRNKACSTKVDTSNAEQQTGSKGKSNIFKKNSSTAASLTSVPPSSDGKRLPSIEIFGRRDQGRDASPIPTPTPQFTEAGGQKVQVVFSSVQSAAMPASLHGDSPLSPWKQRPPVLYPSHNIPDMAPSVTDKTSQKSQGGKGKRRKLSEAKGKSVRNRQKSQAKPADGQEQNIISRAFLEATTDQGQAAISGPCKDAMNALNCYSFQKTDISVGSCDQQANMSVHLQLTPQMKVLSGPQASAHYPSTESGYGSSPSLAANTPLTRRSLPRLTMGCNNAMLEQSVQDHNTELQDLRDDSPVVNMQAMLPAVNQTPQLSKPLVPLPILTFQAEQAVFTSLPLDIVGTLPQEPHVSGNAPMDRTLKVCDNFEDVEMMEQPSGNHDAHDRTVEARGEQRSFENEQLSPAQEDLNANVRNVTPSDKLTTINKSTCNDEGAVIPDKSCASTQKTDTSPLGKIATVVQNMPPGKKPVSRKLVGSPPKRKPQTLDELPPGSVVVEGTAKVPIRRIQTGESTYSYINECQDQTVQEKGPENNLMVLADASDLVERLSSPSKVDVNSNNFQLQEKRTTENNRRSACELSAKVTASLCSANDQPYCTEDNSNTEAQIASCQSAQETAPERFTNSTAAQGGFSSGSSEGILEKAMMEITGNLSHQSLKEADAKASSNSFCTSIDSMQKDANSNSFCTSIDSMQKEMKDFPNLRRLPLKSSAMQKESCDDLDDKLRSNSPAVTEDSCNVFRILRRTSLDSTVASPIVQEEGRSVSPAVTEGSETRKNFRILRRNSLDSSVPSPVVQEELRSDSPAVTEASETPCPPISVAANSRPADSYVPGFSTMNNSKDDSCVPTSARANDKPVNNCGVSSAAKTMTPTESSPLRSVTGNTEPVDSCPPVATTASSRPVNSSTTSPASTTSSGFVTCVADTVVASSMSVTKEALGDSAKSSEVPATSSTVPTDCTKLTNGTGSEVQTIWQIAASIAQVGNASACVDAEFSDAISLDYSPDSDEIFEDMDVEEKFHPPEQKEVQKDAESNRDFNAATEQQSVQQGTVDCVLKSPKPVSCEENDAMQDKIDRVKRTLDYSEPGICKDPPSKVMKTTLTENGQTSQPAVSSIKHCLKAVGRHCQDDLVPAAGPSTSATGAGTTDFLKRTATDNAFGDVDLRWTRQKSPERSESAVASSSSNSHVGSHASVLQKGNMKLKKLRSPTFLAPRTVSSAEDQGRNRPQPEQPAGVQHSTQQGGGWARNRVVGPGVQPARVYGQQQPTAEPVGGARPLYPWEQDRVHELEQEVRAFVMDSSQKHLRVRVTANDELRKMKRIAEGYGLEISLDGWTVMLNKTRRTKIPAQPVLQRLR